MLHQFIKKIQKCDSVLSKNLFLKSRARGRAIIKINQNKKGRRRENHLRFFSGRPFGVIPSKGTSCRYARHDTNFRRLYAGGDWTASHERAPTPAPVNALTSLTSKKATLLLGGPTPKPTHIRFIGDSPKRSSTLGLAICKTFLQTCKTF